MHCLQCHLQCVLDIELIDVHMLMLMISKAAYWLKLSKIA